MGIYALLLILIYFQGRLLRKKYRDMALLLTNVELILFLSYYTFSLGASRLLALSDFQIIPILFSLLLYFGGLAVCHLSTFKSSSHLRNAWTHTSRELKLLVPFAIPFLVLAAFSDLLSHALSDEWQRFLFDDNVFWGSFLVFGIIALLMVLMMIFLPFWIQKIWQCQPIKDSELKKNLQELCHRAHFKHAGLKTWTVLDHVLTAAIIGIVPRYRYVMFSKRLLRELPGPSVEAVLAHEIGHHYWRHLWLYPFILIGASVVLEGISSIFPQDISPFSLFLLYAFAVAFYFRIVFGFFSRLFERQADLHIFQLGIPSQAMIDALDQIAVATGNSHKHPNWHHYSIQERIDFIREAEAHPDLIQEHHRKVKRYLILYFVVLIGLFIVLAMIQRN